MHHQNCGLKWNNTCCFPCMFDIHQNINNSSSRARPCLANLIIQPSKPLDTCAPDTAEITTTCLDSDALRRRNFVVSSFSGVTFVFSTYVRSSTSKQGPPWIFHMVCTSCVRNSRPKYETDDLSSLIAVVCSQPVCCFLAHDHFGSFFGSGLCSRAIFCRGSTRGTRTFEHGTRVILGSEISSPTN